MDEYNFIVEKLQELGLTKREAEVYLAILMKNGATVKDLLETLDVHQPQLYNIIQSLIRKGFIRASAGRPRVYTANDITALIDVQKMKLDSLKRILQEELGKIRENEGEEPYISYVRSLEGVLASAIETINSAEVEIRAELPYQIYKELSPYFVSALRRGINLYLLVYPTTKSFIELADFKNQIKVKTSELGNFLLIISDLHRAVYSKRRFFTIHKLPISENEVYGYIIHEKDLLLRLLNIHNNLWVKAKEIIGWIPGPEVYPKTFIDFSMALNELEALLRLGYTPIVRVLGRDVKSEYPIEVSGRVRAVNRIGIVSNFILESNEGTFTVGGFDAEIEDIEAQRVIIEKVEREGGKKP